MTSLVVEEGPGIVSDETSISAQRAQRIDAAVTTAQSECLELSSLLYKKLPKELREHVYAHLCLEDRRIPVGPYYHFRKYEPLAERKVGYSDTQYCPRDGDLQTELADGKVRIDHDIYPEGDLILPNNRIFDPSFMGQDVVPELLEMYYGSNSFSVCNIEGGLDELCTAISSSTASSRLVPIDKVRDLQIRMKFEHIKPHVCPMRRVPGCFHTGYVAGDESKLRAAVDTLRTFRSRIRASPREMNIEVILMTDLDTPADAQDAGIYANAYLTNFLQAVRNMVYELLHDCKLVSVRVTHQDDGLMAFPKDYTKLFNLSKEEWEYEKSRQTSNSDWDKDFWILPFESTRLTSQGQAALGGYYIDNLGELLSLRWGVDDIFRGTVSTRNVAEGPYWPVGRPVNPSAMHTYSSKIPSLQLFTNKPIGA